MGDEAKTRQRMGSLLKNKKTEIRKIKSFEFKASCGMKNGFKRFIKLSSVWVQKISFQTIHKLIPETPIEEIKVISIHSRSILDGLDWT